MQFRALGRTGLQVSEIPQLTQLLRVVGFGNGVDGLAARADGSPGWTMESSKGGAAGGVPDHLPRQSGYWISSNREDDRCQDGQTLHAWLPWCAVAAGDHVPVGDAASCTPTALDGRPHWGPDRVSHHERAGEASTRTCERTAITTAKPDLS